jgi:hypothetical protein
VFLLSKQPRYFFDQEAVREAYNPATLERNSYSRTKAVRNDNGGASYLSTKKGGEEVMIEANPAGRNIRSVWEIATQPYPEAHFATFPEELARRCIAAGCPEQVCRVCGKARERILERQNESTYARIQREHGITYQDMKAEAEANGITPGNVGGTHAPGQRGATYVATDNKMLGWTDCGHDDYRLGLTLDPFMGSGTVAHVARKLGRHAVGIDLNEEYLELAARRLQQQSLFA